MIEFPITLTSGGSVCLPGHAFALALGYTKNRGVYRLHVDATGEWAGLTIRCFWHVPDGKDPLSSLVKDGSVAVPASVTAQPGNGCITFEGSDGTKTVQIAYKLAEPMPFTAPGAQPISALSGVNTLLTDADSVTVTGRADPIKRIIDLEDAVASMTTT